MTGNKRVLEVLPAPEMHWVGDGFPVRTLLSLHEHAAKISPFLLLDYAQPTTIPPTTNPRGVGGHPHRGFETVTIVYQGALEHRDSAGHSGTIGPGDVQWMTAASGVIHEELHERNWAQRGGTFQVAQLWVNLPKAHKMSPPRYQTLTSDQIPTVDVAGGSVRVIAGAFEGAKGPAQTFTPLTLYDIRLSAGSRLEFELPDGHNTAIAVLSGKVRLNNTADVTLNEAALLARDGQSIAIDVEQDALLLVMSGQPIDEPIASYGPFVMNTREEILQATQDYQSGRMGSL